ncbi:MAG: nickel-responsive transcriptional regulator NikR [Pirellulaceae bacterium]|jgi:CopG family nickel-responsive transcriptional regulator|nr:nickel-responsive transcriptional regulator NikR [Pirellulaceae bacterium]
MSELVRISMSLENSLMQAFDAYVQAEHYPSRSEAIKALMRQCLSEQAWEHNQLVAGSVTLVYDHHRQGIVKRLMDVQHDYGAIIVSTQHVHLDHHHCLEIVVVKGKASQIREMVTIFKSIKGVKQNSLVMTSIGKALV